nr:PHP domain-containing protein [Leptolyngbya sp. CCY15150]
MSNVETRQLHSLGGDRSHAPRQPRYTEMTINPILFFRLVPANTMLDLHCHSTQSDGSLTPTQLVQEAIAAGLKVLSITDHDTLSGWDEAYQAAAGTSLTLVPGVELSTVHNGRSLHILGFYPNRQALEAPLRERVEGRHRRAQQMAENLAALGYPIILPRLSDTMAPGRPHIAAALVAAGYVRSPQEAFERWLGEDKPAHVAYEKFSAVDGIQLLRRCGAVPVWAHPYLFRGGPVPEVLPTLVEAGLMGLEVYHPNHAERDRRRLAAIGQRYGLLTTGGSDYHGPSPHGAGLNQLQLSLDLLPPLQEGARSLHADQGLDFHLN